MCATLKKLRMERGLTLQEMATLLGLKTASAYCKKEAGSVPVSLDEAKVISDFFQKPMEEIFSQKTFLIRKIEFIILLEGEKINGKAPNKSSR